MGFKPERSGERVVRGHLGFKEYKHNGHVEINHGLALAAEVFTIFFYGVPNYELHKIRLRWWGKHWLLPLIHRVYLWDIH